jgi:lysophospholipase L1-like esterase
MAAVFLFGDSITWGSWDREHGGWAQRLRAEVDRIQLERTEMWCPVYNLGIPGDTATGIAGRIASEIRARHEPAQEVVIVVAVGINDSMVELPSGEGVVQIADFTSALASIHEVAKMFAAKVGFVGLVPIEERLLNPLPWNSSRAYTYERALLFDRALATFCLERQLPFLDLWSALSAQPWKELLHDGLHPNGAGHERIYQEVRSLVMNRFDVCG